MIHKPHPVAPQGVRPLVVALVEDDPLLREEVRLHLESHGFVVHVANSAAGLDDLMVHSLIDLYVIDWNLPGESGLSLSRRLRNALPTAAIVIMTARVALNDRHTGYRDGGADLYLTKPVAPEELVTVLQSLGRRLYSHLTGHEWVMNLRHRTLTGPLPDQKIRLTHREKALLVALIQAKDNTLDSAVLCDLLENELGRDEGALSKHALEEVVARLRKKFRTAQGPDAESAIKSVWGVGYQLCLPVVFS
jgi:DNA-binding response OmpR family regulator